ncbi:MAG: glycosyltransferase family protein [Solirubrobacterales bacterium]
MSRGRVAVAGSIAQRPGRGGHAWVFLQYLLGFRRLGYEVLFVDRLSGEMLAPGESAAAGVRWVEETMGAHGLGESWAVLLDDGESAGRSREQVREHLRDSVLLIDVMGFLADEELAEAAPRRLFLDIDPGFPQMWQELGLHTSFGRHDAYATVGLRVGKEGSTVPTCGIEWIATPQPVVLEQWPVTEPGSAYTSVVSWRGPFGPVEYGGERYGLRAHQMRAFAELPRRAGVPIEVALEIEDADQGDKELLRSGGWSVVPPLQVAAGTEDYRRYVQNSRAEVGVAKDMYVRSRGGWFSDRSICYLASGKPVLAQATGFELELETGAGLLSFADPEEAAAAVAEVEADYRRHSEAARALAEERFDSDRVLGQLLEAAA